MRKGEGPTTAIVRVDPIIKEVAKEKEIIKEEKRDLSPIVVSQELAQKAGLALSRQQIVIAAGLVLAFAYLMKK